MTIILNVIMKYNQLYVPNLNRPERPAGKKDGHHHHHHHHHRHGHSVPSLASRRRPGSEISMKLPLHRVPTEQDEARMLSGVDLDDMTSELSDQSLPGVGPGRGFSPLGRIGPQYPLLIVKGDKKGQRSEKLYLEAVWKELVRVGQKFNYHNKVTNKQTNKQKINL